MAVTERKEYRKLSRLDWQKAEDRYCRYPFDDITLEGIAELFKVSKLTIAKYSSEHNWKEKRKRCFKELEKRLAKDKDGIFNANEELLKEIAEMRSKNAFETAKTALKMRQMLKEWMFEHDRYIRNTKGEIQTDENDIPIENEDKANIKELESASKLNREVYETILLTLGPDIQEEEPFTIDWAIPVNEALEKMTPTELEEHKKLIGEVEQSYEESE